MSTKGRDDLTRVRQAARADALRNRAKVLAAAEEVFAVQGPRPPPRRSRGRGGRDRHGVPALPDQGVAAGGRAVALLERLAAEAEELRSAADPGAAFFGFFSRVVSRAATKQAVTEALAEAGMASTPARPPGAPPGLKAALGVLLERAQAAGAVRGDVGAGEVMALLAGMSYAAGHAGARESVLRIAFDGLRPCPDQAAARRWCDYPLTTTS